MGDFVVVAVLVAVIGAWSVVVVSRMVRAMWTTSRRRRAERAEDDEAIPCRGCGYDLRATPGVCPECGMASPPSAGLTSRRLFTAWPADAVKVRVPAPTEEPCVVYETDDARVMQLMVEQMEARGVKCQWLTPQQIGNAGRTRLYGSHKLVVWSEDVGLARELVEWLLGFAGADPGPGEGVALDYEPRRGRPGGGGHGV